MTCATGTILFIFQHPVPTCYIRWLSVRVEYLGNLLIFLVAVLTFSYKSSLSAGMAGLAITYSMMILDALSWTVRYIVIILSMDNTSSSSGCSVSWRLIVWLLRG